MDSVALQRDAAEAWLRSFANAVRERDYDAGRDMCHAEVTGFGTISRRYDGIDELQHEQWVTVWDRTEGFDFDVDTATIWGDETLVVAVSEWSSTGIEADGTRRPRRGRATIVLAGAIDELRAVHTHFSMSPGFVA